MGKKETLEQENARLKAENIRLKADIKTRDSLAYIADIHGIAQRTVEEIRRLHTENETTKTNLYSLVDRMWSVHDNTRAKFNTSAALFTQRVNLAKDIEETHGLNYVTQAILNQYGPMGEKALAVMDDLRGKRKVAIEQYQAHPENLNADEVLNEISAMERIATIWELGEIIFSLGNIHSKDPRIVAFQIINEVYATKGKCQQETVMRLDLDWIKENINTRIGSHGVLCDAVNYAYSYNEEAKRFGKNGRGTMDTFIAKHSVGHSNLRFYLSYYEKLNEFANSAAKSLSKAIKLQISD